MRLVMAPRDEEETAAISRQRDEARVEVVSAAHPSAKDVTRLPNSLESKAALDVDSPRGKMIEKLIEHLTSAPILRSKLAQKLHLPAKGDAESFAEVLFDHGLSALELAEGLQFARKGLGPTDLLALQEIARLVLPQSAEVRANLAQWKTELEGKILVLPYLSHAEAEIALAGLAERPCQPKLQDAETFADIEVFSEALFPASEIRSGSTKALLTPDPLLHEIAHYFATRVLFGENRRFQGAPAYRPNHPHLNFTVPGNFEKVVREVNAHLRYHHKADLDDLLPMHIDLDVDGLEAHLRNPETGLLDKLGKTFPLLSFVRLDKASSSMPDLRLCMVRIFSKHKPSPQQPGYPPAFSSPEQPQSLFKHTSYPFANKHAQELYDLLVKAYDRIESIDFLVARAGVNPRDFDPGRGAPGPAWKSLLEVALRQQKLQALLDCVLDDKHVQIFHERIQATLDKLR